MDGLPTSLADYGPAALSAVAVAVYLVAGEPVVGAVLHRRFEGRLRTDAGARRSFYLRLLILEWGLALLALVIWWSAPDVDAAAVGLAWPDGWPGPVAGGLALLVVVFVVASTRALRGGVLHELPAPAADAAAGRHAELPVHATLALLPRTRSERRLFTVVGLTAGICEEWLYRGFFLAVVTAIAGDLPDLALVAVAAVAFGLAHAYQGVGGVLTTAVLGAVMAALYLDTGSLLLPVLLHALIDLRFLAVPSRALPSAGVR
ncbi:CPBP family intramembrane glutamic endopeptidase [Blastococcus sp. URHD0036]|uniref:CPBP family intramembrane glutamic endopeptidase n=1 Tax=Blastococcus sp. URHD0036 TaxID=1380356 RepID=UPI0004955665|nr:CPBP family intramembrane glutamic endopeptidase [Blastococcus sp. URHD0036]